MGLITPGAVIIIFLFIVICCILLSYAVKGNKYRETQLGVFLLALGGLSIIMTLIFYYSVIELQQQQGTIAVIEETARVNTLVLENVRNTFDIEAQTIPNFVSSLNPLMPCTESAGQDENTFLACLKRSNLSIRIFITWQDVVNSSTYIDYEWVPVLSGFLQWSNSAQLYDYWNIYYIDYSQNTVGFGNLLFEYGLPITVQTPQSYSEAAVNMSNDPRFLSIIGNS